MNPGVFIALATDMSVCQPEEAARVIAELRTVKIVHTGRFPA